VKKLFALMIAGSLVAAIGCEEKKSTPNKPSGTGTTGTPAKTTESGNHKTTESGSHKTTESGSTKTTAGEGTKTGTKTETKKGDGPAIPEKGDKDKPKGEGK
jgi:hypothetical protein